jgi:hypothetical protein
MTTMYEWMENILAMPLPGPMRNLKPRTIKLKPAQETSITSVFSTKISSSFFIVSISTHDCRRPIPGLCSSLKNTLFKPNSYALKGRKEQSSAPGFLQGRLSDLTGNGNQPFYPRSASASLFSIGLRQSFGKRNKKFFRELVNLTAVGKIEKRTDILF